MNIEWVSVSPGKVFIGSDNRSILFGGVGPRHEVKIDYDYEISYLPIDIEIAQEIIQSEDCFIASESEWTLAMENKLISELYSFPPLYVPSLLGILQVKPRNLYYSVHLTLKRDKRMKHLQKKYF